VGIQTSVKAIREILSKQKKTTKGAGLSRNRTTKNSNQTPVNQEN
jgi:hypothetical protein